MLSTLIVDDIQKLREFLKDSLEKYCPSVNVKGEAGSVKEAITKISRINPDLVFLDIELGDGTAFDLLSALSAVHFKIIFVTAHDDYAIKAFKFSALDYLLKPVDREDLVAAVRKAESAIRKEQTDEKIQVLLSHIVPSGLNSRKIILKTAESIHAVAIDDIVRCESDKNYTSFYLKNGKKIVVSVTLKEYEEILTSSGFFRVHQSHLINMSWFDYFLKNEGGIVVMRDNSQIPVASRKKLELMELIERL